MRAPSFQFFVKDWLSDPQLKMASFTVKGIWADFLAYMWSAPERGKIEGTREQICRLLGATNDEFDQFLSQAETLHFCDTVTPDNGNITIINRRMNREHIAKNNNRLRQKNFRERKRIAQNNELITHVTASASASAKNSCSKEQPADAVPDGSSDPKKSRHLSNHVGGYLEPIKIEIFELKKLKQDPQYGHIKFWQLTQEWTNANGHPQAIYEALRAMRVGWTGIKTSYQGYARKVFDILNGKYHGRECERESKKFKIELDNADPAIKALIADAFKSV